MAHPGNVISKSFITTNSSKLRVAFPHFGLKVSVLLLDQYRETRLCLETHTSS
jgi:hypothetical protein